MKKLLIYALLLISQTVYGQEQHSSHNVRFYLNNKEVKSSGIELTVTVNESTIKAIRQGNNFLLPLLDSAKTYRVTVKVGKISFSCEGYKFWQLNRGSEIVLGRITKIKSLQTVADYNGLTKKDKDWETYSNRFFIVDEKYTIDIDEPQKAKEVLYLVQNPNQSNGYSVAMKVKKTKANNN